jgi:hypothetical protein
MRTKLKAERRAGKFPTRERQAAVVLPEAPRHPWLLGVILVLLLAWTVALGVIAWQVWSTGQAKQPVGEVREASP